MLEFMDYVQNAFYGETNWNRDNSYGSLTDTARALLDFSTPQGLRLNVSSLSSPNFATSYTLGSIGLVDGSLSYLYSSLPFTGTVSKSSLIPLDRLVTGYRQLQDLRKPDESWQWELWQQGKRIDRRDSLLYGRLYLPKSTLEALYLRRLTPRLQLKLSCVSDGRLPNGGSILALLQHDAARHSTEYIYSTDSALLGIRGLYNFGPDPPPRPHPLSPRDTQKQQPPPSPPPPHGRLSAGFELYYGLLNKSSGTSVGLRFATLPAHTGFPYTMTLTLNPLMGNLSSTYSVRASRRLALSSRFDFNFYSYESELMLGLELWRRRRKRKDFDAEVGAGGGDLDWARKKLDLLSSPIAPSSSPSLDDPDPTTAGVLKARLDQRGALALRWEGRVKELLYGCGVVVDFRRPEGIVGGVGLEVGFSS